MDITREQVDAAKQALGLDVHLTHSVTITPSHVHVQTVALTDGHPDVQNGALGITEGLHEIKETTDGDA